jgi:hypothetical protein
MKLERLALGVAMLGLITAGWCARAIHNLQAQLERISADSRFPRPTDKSSSVTNLEERLKTLEAGSPGVGEIMSSVQRHFAKLYFASEARNWELARFERGEILENLNAVAALRPEERGVSITGMLDAFKTTQLVSLLDAVNMKDRRMFREAYQEAILMCNTCHQATGRPFIAITIPTNPPVSNQRWDPAPPVESIQSIPSKSQPAP